MIIVFMWYYINCCNNGPILEAYKQIAKLNKNIVKIKIATQYK